MRKTKLVLLLPILLGLTACGSDSDDVVVETPSGYVNNNPAWNKYMATPGVKLEGFELKGEADVHIGPFDEAVQRYVGMGLALLYGSGDASNDVNGDGNVTTLDAHLAGIENTEMGAVFKADLVAMGEYLATNPDGLGAGTASPQIFKPGSYSPFDLLRYLVGTRDDMRWEGGVESIVKPADSEYDTYEYRISWDKNGDGEFNSDDGEYFNSANWHYALVQSQGQNTQYASMGLAVQYTRMDKYWLREKQRIRFRVFPDEMINRIHWIWKQEQQRLADSDGKFIIPTVVTMDSNVDPMNPPMEVLAQNLEVQPHNLRPDIFQDGVLSFLDVFLTIADQTGADIRLNWWATMSEGAQVNSVTMMDTPWTGPYGGWFAGVPVYGEWAASGDFTMIVPQCNWNKDGSTTFNEDGSIGTPTDPVDMMTCITEWSGYNGVGGNVVNNHPGATIFTYPHQFVALNMIRYELRNAFDIDLHQGDVTEVHVGADELQHMADRSDNMGKNGDGSLYPTADVTGTATLRPMHAATEETKVGNAPILDETHFGWKIADCTQCHKDTADNAMGHGGQPWPVNSTDGFDYMQPFYCATCHGSNGAPEGHNRGARCFWCHNTNNKEGYDSMWMDKHGDASLPKFIPAAKNQANFYTKMTNPTEDGTGNYKLYDDLWFPSHNSDYTLSKTFPDPYSCGTCHGWEHEAPSQTEK